MKAAEKSLLLAVRNRLRAAIVDGGAGFADAECEVENDVTVPATVGHRYVCVTANGWQPGPHHAKSGGVNDLVYSLEVTVVRRAAHIAKDRKRGAFIANLGNLADEMDLIFNAIDWKDAVTIAAEALIAAGGVTVGSGQGFVHPLVFAGMDPKPRPASSEVFSASNDPQAGLMRTIRFSNARRLTVKS